MKKKHIIIFILVFILGAASGAFGFYYFSKPTNYQSPTQSILETQNTSNASEEDNSSLNLPTKGNDTVLTTKVDTTLRVVNEYDKKFLTAKKNLLIMFASWCPNCQQEIGEIEKILKHYKNDKNVNIVLVAHEYNDTVEDLTHLVENDADFGDAEIKLDLGRVIRKTIDPEASTIPISYVVDKKGNILDSHSGSLTLEKAIEMLK